METNESAQTRRIRARLIARLAQESTSPTLAPALKRLREADGITPEQQAAKLGTTLAGLERLALCGLPRDEQFAEDSDALAQYCGCEPETLLSLLRAVQVLETLAQGAATAPAFASDTLKQRPGLQRSGLLIAARDPEDPSAPQEEAAHE